MFRGMVGRQVPGISLQKYPPRQAADTLSLHKALEGAMAKLEAPGASSN